MAPTVTKRGRRWPFWFLVPIYPYRDRLTIRREIVEDWMWTFEQVQGIFYVVVPIRMTVVRLAEGGLLAYAPVAPTAECIRGLRELEAQYGPLKYIILPTISGLEHKVFVGPFARYFPQAQIYVAPNQWSFPISLPLSWLGLPSQRTHVLPPSSQDAPFGTEFDYAIMEPIRLGPGTFEEVAFYHRRSRSLLVTDTVVSIPEDPPEVVQQDPYALLFHARDSASDPMADSDRARRKGWQRIALFALYFRATTLDTRDWPETFREAKTASDRSKKAYFGLYPFRWKDGWRETFQSLRGDGRLRVAPILQLLILNRAPRAVLAWADAIARWDFDRVVPCHFAAPVAATGEDFRRAFTFLESRAALDRPYLESDRVLLPQQDMQVLRDIDAVLVKSGICPPPQS